MDCFGDNAVVKSFLYFWAHFIASSTILTPRSLFLMYNSATIMLLSTLFWNCLKTLMLFSLAPKPETQLTLWNLGFEIGFGIYRLRVYRFVSSIIVRANTS